MFARASAGIFMARSHTAAIFRSCQFLIFDCRPTFRYSAYSESDRRAGASLSPRVYGGLQIREMRAYFRRFSAAFDGFSLKWRTKLLPFPVFYLESNSSWWTVSKMIYILISYLGEFRAIVGQSSIFGSFFRFFVKMAAKPFRFRFSPQIRISRPRLY